MWEGLRRDGGGERGGISVGCNIRKTKEKVKEDNRARKKMRCRKKKMKRCTRKNNKRTKTIRKEKRLDEKKVLQKK